MTENDKQNLKNVCLEQLWIFLVGMIFFIWTHYAFKSIWILYNCFALSGKIDNLTKNKRGKGE